MYETPWLKVHHIDLWRIDEPGETLFAVDLDEILDDPRAVVVIEWADKLPEMSFERRTIEISVEGEGDEPRKISIVDN